MEALSGNGGSGSCERIFGFRFMAGTGGKEGR